jgi:DNA replication and repair protein RecF
LSDFRNYPSASASFDPALNIVYGANGQGKSNLLEAVGLLSIGRSMRGATDGEMVKWGQPSSTVSACVAEASARRVELTIVPGERKRGTIDGADLGGLSELVGIIRTVSMAPDMIEQQFKSAAGRRRMVDVLISQIDRAYLNDLRRCRQIVTQIGAVYRQPQSDATQCEVWERQLATVSLEIARRRQVVIRELREAVGQQFQHLFGAGRLEITMRTTLPLTDEADSIDRAAEVLREGRIVARKVGFVMRGAHRDRFTALLDGRDIESHASQGQMKSAYFAWKIAEGDYIAQETGSNPVWLVDDPFSELDKQRSLALLALLESRGQVLLTTARDDDLGLPTRGFVRLRVSDGTIESASG